MIDTYPDQSKNKLAGPIVGIMLGATAVAAAIYGVHEVQEVFHPSYSEISGVNLDLAHQPPQG